MTNTGNNQNAHVDVLAMIVVASAWAQQVADRGGVPTGVRQAAEGQAYALSRAEKAVAELIEAARPFVALLQGHVDMDEHLNLRRADRPVFAINDAVITVGDLRALSRSLARCKGGAL